MAQYDQKRRNQENHQAREDRLKRRRELDQQRRQQESQNSRKNRLERNKLSANRGRSKKRASRPRWEGAELQEHIREQQLKGIPGKKIEFKFQKQPNED